VSFTNTGADQSRPSDLGLIRAEVYERTQWTAGYGLRRKDESVAIAEQGA